MTELRNPSKFSNFLREVIPEDVKKGLRKVTPFTKAQARSTTSESFQSVKEASIKSIQSSAGDKYIQSKGTVKKAQEDLASFDKKMAPSIEEHKIKESEAIGAIESSTKRTVSEIKKSTMDSPNLSNAMKEILTGTLAKQGIDIETLTPDEYNNITDVYFGGVSHSSVLLEGGNLEEGYREKIAYNVVNFAKANEYTSKALTQISVDLIQAKNSRMRAYQEKHIDANLSGELANMLTYTYTNANDLGKTLITGKDYVIKDGRKMMMTEAQIKDFRDKVDERDSRGYWKEVGEGVYEYLIEEQAIVDIGLGIVEIASIGTATPAVLSAKGAQTANITRKAVATSKKFKKLVASSSSGKASDALNPTLLKKLEDFKEINSLENIDEAIKIVDSSLLTKADKKVINIYRKEARKAMPQKSITDKAFGAALGGIGISRDSHFMTGFNVLLPTTAMALQGTQPGEYIENTMMGPTNIAKWAVKETMKKIK